MKDINKYVKEAFKRKGFATFSLGEEYYEPSLGYGYDCLRLHPDGRFYYDSFVCYANNKITNEEAIGIAKKNRFVCFNKSDVIEIIKEYAN